MPLRTGENSQQESEELEQESTSQQNQTTNQQEDSATKDDGYYKLLEKTIASNAEAMRAMQEQNRRLAEQVNRIETRTNEPPKPERSVEEVRAEFFDNPAQSIRSLFKEEFDKTVAPLQKQVAQLLNQGASAKLLDKFKTNPKIRNALADRLVERHVENIVQQQIDMGVEITENIVLTAVIQVVGLKSIEMLPAIDGFEPEPRIVDSSRGDGNRQEVINETGGREIVSENSTQRGNKGMSTPAHLRPSAPAGPRGNNGGKKITREWTENEKRLMRELKMTEQEYVEFQNLDAAEVASYVGDRPKGGK